MRSGAGLLLICVGAILAFAVTANTSVFNLHTAGYVLIVVGLAGLLVPGRGRRVLVRRTSTCAEDIPADTEHADTVAIEDAYEDDPSAH